MLGFVIGTACLIGLIKVLRRGRWAHHGYGYGHGCGGGPGAACDGDEEGAGGGPPWRRWGRWGGGHGGFGWARGGFGGFGMRRMTHWLSAHLDASPAQEKVIRSSVEEVREALRKARDDVRGSASGLADALRADSLDASALGEIFAKHDSALEDVRKTVVGALAKVHDALDERQRKALADLVARWTGGRVGDEGGHPYRTATA